MEVRIKDDSVEIDGYVNAIERKSKPLNSRIGKFVERIKKGAFKRAIERNDNIRILLNHDWNKDLGGTKDGNLELTEDNILPQPFNPQVAEVVAQAVKSHIS